jgi:hypothetical protein
LSHQRRCVGHVRHMLVMRCKQVNAGRALANRE